MLTIVLIAGMLPVSTFASDLDEAFPESGFETLKSIPETGSFTEEHFEDPLPENTVAEQQTPQEETGEQTSDPEDREEVPDTQEETNAPAETGADSDETETGSSEENSSGADSAQPSAEEEQPDQTEPKAVVDDQPEPAAEKEPEYEELEFNHPYELTAAEPEQLFIYRMPVWAEKNIHFVTKGMDLLMNVFNEDTQQYVFEEHQELLDGEDNVWLFPAASYLVVFRLETGLPGDILFCAMDDDTAAQYFAAGPPCRFRGGDSDCLRV